jgi:hypothetical protein
VRIEGDGVGEDADRQRLRREERKREQHVRS